MAIHDEGEIARTADRIRRRVLEHVVQNGGGYLSQACSSAELLATLYGGIVRLAPLDEPQTPGPFQGVPRPGWRPAFGASYHGTKAPEYDRLIFSPAHYALVLYATLIEVGRLAPEALSEFNVDGSTLEMIGAEHSPGFETTTGSLAQALSHAGGIALARRLRGETGRTWVFMSDGEFQEGQTWEALAALSFHELGSVTAVVDVNGQQVDGPTETVMTIEPLADRVRAFGAVAHSVDGHDIEAVSDASRQAHPTKPTVVLCHTNPMRGVDLLATRAPMLHYLRFENEAEKNSYRELLEEWEHAV